MGSSNVDQTILQIFASEKKCDCGSRLSVDGIKNGIILAFCAKCGKAYSNVIDENGGFKAASTQLAQLKDKLI